eukprot:3922_1
MSESSRWTYKWQITNDTSMLKQMKNAKNTDIWTSSVFSACGFKWYLKVCPNGRTKDVKGSVNFYVALAVLPANVKSIHVVFSFGLIEIGKISNTSQAFVENHKCWGWHGKQLQTTKLQNLNTLTFVAKIEVATVFDKNDNDITNQYINIPHEESKQNQSQEQKQLVEA